MEGWTALILQEGCTIAFLEDEGSAYFAQTN